MSSDARGVGCLLGPIVVKFYSLEREREKERGGDQQEGAGFSLRNVFYPNFFVGFHWSKTFTFIYIYLVMFNIFKPMPRVLPFP